MRRIKQIVRAYDTCIGVRRGIPDETAQLLELLGSKLPEAS